jgi:hypothetical protein
MITLFTAHWLEVDGVSARIAMMIKLNQFISAWHQVMAKAEISQLCEFYLVGKEVTKEMKIEPLTLGFPATWPTLVILQCRNSSNP